MSDTERAEAYIVTPTPLKPCPFCGQKAAAFEIKDKKDGPIKFGCSTIDCVGPVTSSYSKWNRRVDNR